MTPDTNLIKTTTAVRTLDEEEIISRKTFIYLSMMCEK
jgi:hypothetical protein